MATSTRNYKQFIVIGVLVGVILLVLLALFLSLGANGEARPPLGAELPPKEPQRQLQASGKKGAVASDVDVCSRAGVDALKEGGSAVDAAIVAQLCVEVINLQSSGIGGGGFMLVYNSTDGSAHAVDCRETVPSAFANATVRDEMLADVRERKRIGTSGTPGALRCYKRLHDMYGRLPWARIFRPSIELAQYGFRVSKQLARAIRKHVRRDDEMSLALRNHILPNGVPAKAGQLLTRRQLAATLRQIVVDGPDAFYRGPIGLALVRDVQAAGGHLSLDDFASYEEVLRRPVEANVFHHRVLSVGPPTSGSVVIFALKMLEELIGRNSTTTSTMDEDADAWQRIAEILKFAFVLRARIGDPAFNRTVVDDAVANMLDDRTAQRAAELIERFVEERDGRREIGEYTQVVGGGIVSEPPEDHGTSGTSAVDSEGLACASFISINYNFGSRFMSPSTGILLNNHLEDFDDFGAPHDEQVNMLEPLKRMRSSMSPLVLHKKGERLVVLDGSGGTRIVSGLFQVAARIMAFNESLVDGVEKARVHIVWPNKKLIVDAAIGGEVIDELKARGYKVQAFPRFGSTGVINGVMRLENGTVQAQSDSRKFAVGAAY